jgi:tetratricopeptide (TPR) repeat protein
MDLTSLTYVLVLLFGYLGVDAALHPPDAILEAEAVGTFATIKSGLVDEVLRQEVERIAATPTVMTKPVMRVGRLEGLAMSLAEAANMQSVAYALQAQLGSRPDQIKFTLFGEDGTAKVLVTGIGRQRMQSFQQELVLQSGETLVGLLQRAAVVGMAHLDPYLTALNEMLSHAEDKNFTTAQAIIDYSLATLPPTPEHFERSLFENLNGLIALFNGDAAAAHEWFYRADASSPVGSTAETVIWLNYCFADIQSDHDAGAAKDIEELLRDKPPTDKILLSTAYMTQAAAYLGSQRSEDADRAIAKAIAAYPEGAIAYDLWADVKRERGEATEADRLHHKALENSNRFENYGEIAALYFRLAWRNNAPVMRSPYSNPKLNLFR